MIEHYIGEVRAFTTTIPTGFLECDGSTPLIANYPALAAMLGTTFGGNGVTTFGLPDTRGRTIIGVGTGAGLTTRTLANTGGMETVQLIDNDLPSHNHTIAVVNNNTSGSTGPSPTRIWGVPSGAPFLLYKTNPTNADTALSNETIGYNGVSPTPSPHQNMQPFFAVRYAIATYTLKTFSLGDEATVSDNKTANLQITLNDSTNALDTKVANAQLSLNDNTVNSDDKTTDAQLPLNDSVSIAQGITSLGFYLNDNTITSDSTTLDAQIVLSDSTIVSDNKAISVELILSDGITVTDKITSLAFFISDNAAISDTVSPTELPGNLFEIYSQADNGAVDLIINLVEDDRLPVLVFAILDSDNSLYNLTGATVRLLVRERDALPGDFKINQLMEILPSGFVRYQLQANDTDTPGEYYSEVEISFSGIIMTSQQFLIRIREQL